MLLNSYVFILAFLPIAILGYRALSGARSREAGIAWLVACSVVYYGWWDVRYLALLFATISFNYLGGRWIAATQDTTRRRVLLFVGIAGNLATLGYYKYANFFVDSVAALTPLDWSLDTIVLPIGVSFFIFQQIAYLVDVSRSGVAEKNVVHYALFVAFFPQLIAGPIVHHGEMLPQFGVEPDPAERSRDTAMGLTLFAIGLAKKVLLADTFSLYASPLFEAADAGAATSFADGWTAAASYTFQIYFDFSGYTDMAIGAALMCSIRLPLNFASPYRSENIIEFWRRWHMTLSRFLRDYLYFPLGGNRRGKARRYLNLMITMLLGGLWHGAGWNFVFWGFLHGAYLCVNHAWRALPFQIPTNRVGPWVARVVTLFFVVLAWVPFRATTTEGSFSILRGMLGGQGIGLESTFSNAEVFPLLALTLAGVWLLPNSQTLVGTHAPRSDDPEVLRPRSEEAHGYQGVRIRWAPTRAWAAFAWGLLATAILQLSRPSEFIYYQF